MGVNIMIARSAGDDVPAEDWDSLRRPGDSDLATFLEGLQSEKQYLQDLETPFRPFATADWRRAAAAFGGDSRRLTDLLNCLDRHPGAWVRISR